MTAAAGVTRFLTALNVRKVRKKSKPIRRGEISAILHDPRISEASSVRQRLRDTHKYTHKHTFTCILRDTRISEASSLRRRLWPLFLPPIGRDRETDRRTNNVFVVGVKECGHVLFHTSHVPSPLTHSVPLICGAYFPSREKFDSQHLRQMYFIVQ